MSSISNLIKTSRNSVEEFIDDIEAEQFGTYLKLAIITKGKLKQCIEAEIVRWLEEKRLRGEKNKK